MTTGFPKSLLLWCRKKVEKGKKKVNKVSLGVDWDILQASLASTTDKMVLVVVLKY